MNFYFILNWKNQGHAFIFAPNDLKFCVQNLTTITQKNDKIAIVKFCLQIAQNCNQSCTNFQFSQRVVQFIFLPPGGLWCHMQIISSWRELIYSHVDTLNIEIRPLYQEIQAEQVGCKICDGTQNGTDSLQYYKGQYSKIYIDENSLVEYSKEKTEGYIKLVFIYVNLLKT